MYWINKYQLISVIFLLLFACKKESDSPSGSNKIEFGSTTIDTTSYFFAEVTSAITNTGGNQLTQHGHCWSKTENPTIEDSTTSLGSIGSPKSFSSEIINLEPNTNYYIRAYAVYSSGTIYSDVTQIKTLKTGLPVVETGDLSDPTITGITCSGIAIADSGLTIIQKGFCWSEESNPSLENNIGFSQEGGGLGEFLDTIGNLDEGNQYYIIAYATNERGTSYGEIKTFQTIPITLPVVITSDITEITTSSAICGGEVIENGNGTLTARGVCWDTQPNPSLDNNIGYSTNGSGTGFFISNITNLAYPQQYYVCSYATNQKGTAYGEVKSFETYQAPCGDLTIEYGGQVYHTVLIGQQCWMKENLNVGTRIDGSESQSDNGSIEKYCYDNSESNCNTYGGLYQWEEAMQYLLGEGAQGICPEGWHIPSDEEWTILTDYLGGESVAGAKLKEAGSVHWNPPNSGATNESGFTALPGGRFTGIYSALRHLGHFWSSSQFDTTKAWVRELSDYLNEVSRYGGYKEYGHSVRCIKNN